LTMPQMMLISVVLPAPLGPSKANISPRFISRLIFLSAWKPLAYVLLTPRTKMMGTEFSAVMVADVGIVFMDECNTVYRHHLTLIGYRGAGSSNIALFFRSVLEIKLMEFLP